MCDDLHVKATCDGKVTRMIHGPLERSDKMWLSIYTSWRGRWTDRRVRVSLASLNLSDEFDRFDGRWETTPVPLLSSHIVLSLDVKLDPVTLPLFLSTLFLLNIKQFIQTHRCTKTFFGPSEQRRKF
jgi:hypothetical protein